MVTFDAYVFDLDGVLRDSKADLGECYGEAFRALGLPFSFDADFTWRLRAFDPYFKMHECIPALYALDQSKSDVRAFFERADWRTFLKSVMNRHPMPAGLYEQTMDAYRAAVARHHSPAIPGSLSALRALAARDVKIGIFAHETTPLAWRWRIEQDAGSLFTPKSVMGLGEYGVTPKPDPSGLLEVCQNLGVPPARTAYVGDSQADVLCAKNAGAFSIGITTGMARREDLEAVASDRVIDSMDELLGGSFLA